MGEPVDEQVVPGHDPENGQRKNVDDDANGHDPGRTDLTITFRKSRLYRSAHRNSTDKYAFDEQGNYQCLEEI